VSARKENSGPLGKGPEEGEERILKESERQSIVFV